MGPTKVFKTIYEKPHSLRAIFGTTDTRNATHGSDSVDNARNEMKIFFPDFDADDWYKNEEEYFLNSRISFNSELSEHSAIKH